ncbi:MAG: ABC transporter substrate-binding protein, partial [Methylobacteriaceae bacterium]|nr:ABC transporter substrate-binding protein [Methylobacteriaceae bacterium]
MKLSTKLIFGTVLAVALSWPVMAKNLVYCSEGSPEGFDPAPYTSGTSFDASSRPIYSRLVEFKKGTTEIVPGLAESWEVSADGKEYVFHLRKGVKFHTTGYFTPTREFNAEDVMFSFLRQQGAIEAWKEYTPGIEYEYYKSMDMHNLISKIEKVDDYTVKMTLIRPESPFLANLAMDFASVVSEEYAANLEKAGKKEQFNLQPVGTGPFVFVDYQKDAVIRYKKFDGYFGEKAKVDNLIFSITQDASVRGQKLIKGECQIMPYPVPADVKNLKADANLQVMEGAGLNVAYVAFNTLVAPYDNVDVRRALNMAVNKKAIIEAVFEGGGMVAKNPIPPTMWSYNDAVPEDKYDPEGAKALLEKAGVKDLSLKLWAMPVSRPYMPNARRTAEMMQADFDKIGVKTEIVSMEWGEYLKRAAEKTRDGIAILGWTGDNGDPDNFMRVLLGCAAVGGSN